MKLSDLIKEGVETVFDVQCPYCSERMSSRVEFITKQKFLRHILEKHATKVVDLILE